MRQQMLIFVALGIELSTPTSVESAAGGDCHSIPAAARHGDVITLEVEPSVSEFVVDDAIDHWAACTSYGVDFPRFSRHPGGSRTVHVRVSARSRTSHRCGVFRGDTITLFREALDARGRLVSCGVLAKNLAHELGHVLGLGDVDERCPFKIMGPTSSSLLRRRVVTVQECLAVGETWLTSSERRDEEQLAELARVAPVSVWTLRLSSDPPWVPTP